MKKAVLRCCPRWRSKFPAAVPRGAVSHWPWPRGYTCSMTQAQFPPRGRLSLMRGALLALTLVFSQAGALVHGYSHSHAGAPNALPSAPASVGQACPDCLSFAVVLAAAGSRSHAFNPARGCIGAPAAPATAHLVGLSPRHAFLSRAPPAL